MVQGNTTRLCLWWIWKLRFAGIRRAGRPSPALSANGTTPCARCRVGWGAIKSQSRSWFLQSWWLHCSYSSHRWGPSSRNRALSTYRCQWWQFRADALLSVGGRGQSRVPLEVTCEKRLVGKVQPIGYLLDRLVGIGKQELDQCHGPFGYPLHR